MNRTVTAMLLGGALAMGSAAQAQEHKLSVSLDTAPSHVRNVSIHAFSDEILKRSGGRLAIEVFDSASQYRDPDVAVALAQGAVDMAVPADQHLSKFVPETGVLLLPIVYGLPRETLYRVTDGPLGDEIRRALEEKLDVVILGRALDLGHGTVFTSDSAIVTPEGLQGRKVRVPGGAATLERYRVFGASPVQIAWSDLPQALERDTVQTIWATHESVRSAQLWDAGIKYAFDDRQAYVQYVPMVSAAAWNRLPNDLQTLMRSTWDQMVDGFREEAAERQAASLEVNRDHGITVVLPDAISLDAMRNKLLAAQPQIVEELKMDADFIARVQAEFDGSSD